MRKRYIIKGKTKKDGKIEQFSRDDIGSAVGIGENFYNCTIFQDGVPVYRGRQGIMKTVSLHERLKKARELALK